MPPSRKTEMALMGMMEKFFESHTSCECSECKSTAKKAKKLTAQMSNRDINKENCSPSKESPIIDSDRHQCSEHRLPPLSRKVGTKEKEKDKEKSINHGDTHQPNRADKINRLLKADSIPAVLEVFKSTPTTAEESKLATELQDETAQCKTFVESKAKIITFCHDDAVDYDAVFGLLAKFRQERSILTSAIIKSNSEREKCLQAIHEVDDLMSMLRDVAKDGKGPSGDDIRHSLGNLIFKVHELARNPSSLYEELMDLREEHLDLLGDHEEQREKFLDIESCHEKLHEDKKRLQEDLAWEKRDHLETRKKLSALSGTKNEVNQAHKSLEKVHEDNANLKKEVDKLTAELAKINALKHENTQLKKKLATAESVKAESRILETPSEPSTKKKKGKKAGANSAVAETAAPSPSTEVEQSSEPGHDRDLKALKLANSEIQSQLGTTQTNLRQVEALLKKAEVAKTKALERQQIEQATAQNWKELSEGHLEESNRLREQLDESMTNAANLQNSVHRLEQNLAEIKDQMKTQIQKRAASPSIQSQTSTTSKFDVESLRVLRKVRGETAQLVEDLDTARNYPGDPWNLVECTRNMIAAIDQDLDGMLGTLRESDVPNPIPDTYLPYPRNDLGFQSPMPMPRPADPTPPLSTVRPRNPSSYHRPLLPPGLADVNMGRSSPTPAHFPSPIGTGRPTKTSTGLTPSPTQTPAKTVSFTAPAANTIGNGAAGVDWSIWAKR